MSYWYLCAALNHYHLLIQKDTCGSISTKWIFHFELHAQVHSLCDILIVWEFELFGAFLVYSCNKRLSFVANDRFIQWIIESGLNWAAPSTFVLYLSPRQSISNRSVSYCALLATDWLFFNSVSHSLTITFFFFIFQSLQCTVTHCHWPHLNPLHQHYLRLLQCLLHLQQLYLP